MDNQSRSSRPKQERVANRQVGRIAAAVAAHDASAIAEALGSAARAHGMTRLSRETGLARQALYRDLRAGGNPRLDTLLKVLRGLKLRIVLEPEQAGSSSPAHPREDGAGRPARDATGVTLASI